MTQGIILREQDILKVSRGHVIFMAQDIVLRPHDKLSKLQDKILRVKDIIRSWSQDFMTRFILKEQLYLIRTFSTFVCNGKHARQPGRSVFSFSFEIQKGRLLIFKP